MHRNISEEKTKQNNNKSIQIKQFGFTIIK